MKEKKYGVILRNCLKFSFYILIPIILILPFVFNDNILYSMFLLYPSGLLVLFLIKNIIRIISLLEKDNPFNKDTINVLKNGSIISLSLCVLFICDLVVIDNMHMSSLNYTNIFSFLIIIFLIVGVILFILNKLFIKGMESKKEIDKKKKENKKNDNIK